MLLLVSMFSLLMSFVGVSLALSTLTHTIVIPVASPVLLVSITPSVPASLATPSSPIIPCSVPCFPSISVVVLVFQLVVSICIM